MLGCVAPPPPAGALPSTDPHIAAEEARSRKLLSRYKQPHPVARAHYPIPDQQSLVRSVMQNITLCVFGGLQFDCPDLLYRSVPKETNAMPSNCQLYISECASLKTLIHLGILDHLSITAGRYNMFALNASGIALGDAGVRALLPLVRRNAGVLRAVSLRHCDLNTTTFVELLSVLEAARCNELQILDISCNCRVDDGIADALVAFAERHRSLRRVGLQKCNISRGQMERIAAVVFRSSSSKARGSLDTSDASSHATASSDDDTSNKSNSTPRKFGGASVIEPTPPKWSHPNASSTRSRSERAAANASPLTRQLIKRESVDDGLRDDHAANELPNSFVDDADNGVHSSSTAPPSPLLQPSTATERQRRLQHHQRVSFKAVDAQCGDIPQRQQQRAAAPTRPTAQAKRPQQISPHILNHSAARRQRHRSSSSALVASPTAATQRNMQRDGPFVLSRAEFRAAIASFERIMNRTTCCVDMQTFHDQQPHSYNLVRRKMANRDPPVESINFAVYLEALFPMYPRMRLLEAMEQYSEFAFVQAVGGRASAARLRVDQRLEMEAMFASLDRDGDGIVTRDDLARILSDAGREAAELVLGKLGVQGLDIEAYVALTAPYLAEAKRRKRWR